MSALELTTVEGKILNDFGGTGYTENLDAFLDAALVDGVNVNGVQAIKGILRSANQKVDENLLRILATALRAGRLKVLNAGTPVANAEHPTSLNFIGGWTVTADANGNVSLTPPTSTSNDAPGGVNPWRGTDPIEGWYPAGYGTNTSTTSMSAGVIIAVPLDRRIRGRIDRIGVDVATGAVGATARLGIYEVGGNGYPAARVYDALITCESTGVVYASPDLTLEPQKDYMLAYMAGTTSATIRTFTGSVLSLGPGWSATSFQTNSRVSLSKAGYFATNPLPSTFPVGAATDTRNPTICVRLTAT